VVRSFLEAFADDNGKVTLAGTSYGGSLAWALGITDPGIVDRIFLINPMPPHPRKRFRDPVLKIFISFAKHPAVLGAFILSPLGRTMLPHLERLFRFAYMDDLSKKRNVAHMTQRKLKVILHIVQRFLWICDSENWAFWESRLNTLDVPVHIIWGDDDKLFDRKVYLRMDQIFPNSTIQCIAGGKHMMVRGEAKGVIEAMKKHLKINPLRVVK
jgi:pimeloyl-ACP methyl ester carboxylesterase